MWGWLWIAGVLLAVVGCYVYTRRRPARLIPESLYLVSFDDYDVTVVDPVGQHHRIAWDELTCAGIRTTSDGPLLPDVFWWFHAGSEEPKVVFPGGATGETELLAELQRRLPTFNNDQLIEAMASTADAYFPLWRRQVST